MKKMLAILMILGLVCSSSGLALSATAQQAAPAAGGEKIHQRRAAESGGHSSSTDRKLEFSGSVEPEMFNHPGSGPGAVFRTRAFEGRTGSGTRRQKFSIVR